MAVGPLGGIQSSPIQSGETAPTGQRGAVNAGDANRFGKLMQPAAEGTRSDKASPEEISQYKQLNSRAMTLIEKRGNMTEMDRAELQKIQAELQTLASSYPPTGEDAARLQGMDQKLQALGQKNPKTAIDIREMADISRAANEIRFQAFRS